MRRRSQGTQGVPADAPRPGAKALVRAASRAYARAARACRPVCPRVITAGLDSASTYGTRMVTHSHQYKSTLYTMHMHLSRASTGVVWLPWWSVMTVISTVRASTVKKYIN